MGKQSSLIHYGSNDHKEIFLDGKYHDAMYQGSELIWEKILFDVNDAKKMDGVPLTLFNDYHIYVDGSGNQYFMNTSGDESCILEANGNELWSSVIDGNCENVDGTISQNGIWYYSNQGYLSRVLASSGTFNKVDILTGNVTHLLNKPKNYLRNINPSVMLADGRIFCPFGKIGYNFTSEKDGTKLYVPYQWNYTDASQFSYYMWLVSSKDNVQYSYSRFCTDEETRSRIFGIRHTKGSNDDFSDCLTEIVELNHSFSDITSVGNADAAYSNDTFSDVNVFLQFTGHFNIDSDGSCQDFSRIFKCVNNTLFVTVIEEDSGTRTLYAINVDTKEVKEVDVPLSYFDVSYINGKYVFAGNVSESQQIVIDVKGAISYTSDFEKWTTKFISVNGQSVKAYNCYLFNNVLYLQDEYVYKVIL